jgi:arginyl-tRNA synthetase
MNVREKLKSDILGILSDAGIRKDEAGKLLEAPPEATGADLALPCFSLAQHGGKHPVQFAKELSKRVKVKGLVKDVKAAGAYLNFYADWDKIGQMLLEYILKNPEYGKGEKRKEKLLVEHTSANPDGPLHIGHLRNAVLGDSLARIFRFSGWNVETEFWVNDSGRQIAIAVMELKKKKSKPEGKPDWWVCDLYVKGNKEIEKNPALGEEVQRIIRKYEKGDKKLIRDYAFIVDNCLKGHKETLKKLGIKIDNFVKDSKFFFGNHVQKILDEVKKRVDVGNVEGKRIWVDLKRFGIEREFTLTRSDGTVIYPAKDLAYHADKFRRADYNINVLGTDHKFYAKQLVSTLSLLYPQKAERYYILFYEHLLLPEGQMSTRKGKFIPIDELLEKVFNAARKAVEEKMPDYSEELKNRIAKTVGTGALKYAMLKVSPERTYAFSIEDTLSFDGDTAPYIQYTYARAQSILRKTKARTTGKFHARLLKSGKEMRLVKHLSEFPDVVSAAVRDYRPHYICSYVFNLATLFNDFYQTVPVLKADKGERAARLALVKSVSSVLKKGLWLLGIDAPERM